MAIKIQEKIQVDEKKTRKKMLIKVKTDLSLMIIDIMMPTSLSESTQMISNMGLTHLGSEASISCMNLFSNSIYFFVFYLFFRQ